MNFQATNALACYNYWHKLAFPAKGCKEYALLQYNITKTELSETQHIHAKLYKYMYYDKKMLSCGAILCLWVLQRVFTIIILLPRFLSHYDYNHSMADI
jgi:hypothetical protein